MDRYRWYGGDTANFGIVNDRYLAVWSVCMVFCIVGELVLLVVVVKS